MRFASFLLLAGMSLFGGCSLNNNGSECTMDSQCGDDVCARNGECLSASSVHSVVVSWTVNSAAASGSAACAQSPDLYVQFDGTDYGDAVRFAPVPCAAGLFTVDKLPMRYQSVVVGFEGASRGQGDAASIDAAAAGARATLNLFAPAADASTNATPE